MNKGDKVRLHPRHYKYSRYKDLVWEIDLVLPSGINVLLFTKSPTDNSVTLTTLASKNEIISIHKSLWECFNCDLLMELETESRPTCPECNNLMSGAKNERNHR